MLCMQVAKQEAKATQAALRQQKSRLTATDRGALLGETALPAGPPSSAPQLAGRPDVSGIAGMWWLLTEGCSVCE